MASKDLRFDIKQLIINANGDPFILSDFEPIDDQYSEPLVIKSNQDGEEQVERVEKVTKEIHHSRFITLYFKSGNMGPYPDKVIDVNDENLSEVDNPRNPEQIELDNQFFVVIDVERQLIYISNLKKKGFISKWLTEKLDRASYIKSIIKKEDFIDNIETVDEINFTLEPDLFDLSETGSLNEVLAKHLFNYSADVIRVEMKYKSTTLSSRLKSLIKGDFFDKQSQYKNLSIVGRTSDAKFERTFNLREVSERILINVDIEDRISMFDPSKVFAALINKIVANEKQ